MNGTPPIELLNVRKIDYNSFRQFGPQEFHGSCPWCGGDDRFVIWTDRPYPSWVCFCRVCTPERFFLDTVDPSIKVPLTPEQRQEYAKEKTRIEQERKEFAAKALQRITTDELWSELNKRMSGENKAWWTKRGVPEEWQAYLSLGYMADKVIKAGDVLHHTPAYSIPYMRDTGQPITMQYRLVNPIDPKDKYRFEYGLPAAFYMTEPYDAPGDQVVICEGAIKAIVTKVFGGMRSDVKVLAVPSKSTWCNVTEFVKSCGRVWIILDPDGTREALSLARKIGKAAKVIQLPMKIDDALNSGALTQAGLKNYFISARRIDA